MTCLSICRVLVAAAGLACAALAVQAQEFEKNILTGGPSGTYIQFGNNIAGLAQNCGLTLNVRESAGSLENFIGVRQRPHTQFGIVQSDVLEYLKTYSADDPAIARAIRGVRIAFPLYNEEIHVLARREIGGLGDLDGARVAVGVEDSGTFLTASLVLDIVGVQPAERALIGPDAALEALLAGEIDALFYVAGAPTRLFQDDRIDAGRWHLLPVEDDVLGAVYQPTRIAADTYPFQSEEVPAIAVKAVLMTYEYDARRNAYHRASCDAVRDMANLIFTRFADLKETGHPKWQQVDLTDIPPGWEIGACVNLGLASDYSLECTPPAMAGPGPASEANAVYRRQICAAIGC
ncbi:TAXI family TRAP transporter solute-binding subunit [Limimaricola pyoseonensis]|uniref:TRAP transporter solute receptor, TAXI family n=1 Tax=Limimaricola pyoseonensis TaxID=521013 RepID=A0A1G7KP54_9RHOB|nr:TAXI family TRAP transporter solute-binding subunit [Limimaricola pyoseonensis]SDF39038.1 hypothetical protein SAMN04488567_0257 [Limimaricola pyoseonensis]